MPRKSRRRMVGGKQEDAAQAEREERLKALMKEIHDQRLAMEREAREAEEKTNEGNHFGESLSDPDSNDRDA